MPLRDTQHKYCLTHVPCLAGFVKVHTREGKDTIVGATIVAANAGDMISELTLAMQSGTGLGTLAYVIHPYPTQVCSDDTALLHAATTNSRRALDSQMSDTDFCGLTELRWHMSSPFRCDRT